MQLVPENWKVYYLSQQEWIGHVGLFQYGWVSWLLHSPSLQHDGLETSLIQEQHTHLYSIYRVTNSYNTWMTKKTR